MAELADAPDLGSGVSDVQVQVLSPAPEDCQKKSIAVKQLTSFVYRDMFYKTPFKESNAMVFSGLCLITKDVKRLSDFYKMVLKTASDCDDEIHQEILTEGAALAILRCEDASKVGNANMSMAFTVDDVDEEFVRLQKLGVSIIDPPTIRSWGAKNMRFSDPDGNSIVFRSFPKS